MNNTKILLVSSLIAALAATSAFARGPGGGGNGNGGGGDQRQYQGQRGAAAGTVQRPQNNCDGTGPGAGDPALCDGSGPGQGTPRHDGTGKALHNRGNPNSTGTPVKDGSGRATAPGNGPKDGTGNNANCPNPTPKS